MSIITWNITNYHWRNEIIKTVANCIKFGPGLVRAGLVGGGLVRGALVLSSLCTATPIGFLCLTILRYELKWRLWLTLFSVKLTVFWLHYSKTVTVRIFLILGWNCIVSSTLSNSLYRILYLILYNMVNMVRRTWIVFFDSLNNLFEF